MLWLILCTIAAAIWSLGAFIDNYQTDVIFRNNKPQAMKILNGPIYIVIGIVVAFVAKMQMPELWQIGLLLLSGAINSVGSIAYYKALKNEEATGAAIFYQLQPILFLLINCLIFGDQISIRQIIGFVLILAAPLTVIFSRKRASARRTEIRAAILLIIYVVMATISGEIAIKVGQHLNFIPVFVFYIIGRGLSDCCIGLTPSLRRRHRYVMRTMRKQYLSTLIINQILNTGAEFAYRFGLILGISAIASAYTNAAELVLTFVLGVILSIIFPKFGREKLQRGLVLAHVIAVIFCVIGIIVIQ